MIETETPIFTIQSEITKASIDNLSKAITTFSRSISSICFSDQFIEISALLSAISNSMILLAEKAGIPQNSFDFLKELRNEKRYDGIELQVNAKNKAAYEMYLNCGFTDKSINMELL